MTEEKSKIEIGEDWWYRQTIGILTQCIENLVDVHEEKYFNEKQMKQIDFKARDLRDMIPSWDDIQRERIKKKK